MEDARLNLPGPDHYAPHAVGSFPTPRAGASSAPPSPSRRGISLPWFREGYDAFQPGGDVDPLPSYIPLEDATFASRYPLYLLSPKSHAFLNSQYGNMARHRRVQGEQAVTINAVDAEAKGIHDGQPVRVFNDQGQLQAIARIALDGTVARGVAVCPLGQWAKLNADGATVNAVTCTGFADLGNAPTFSHTRVDIALLTGNGAPAVT